MKINEIAKYLGKKVTVFFKDGTQHTGTIWKWTCLEYKLDNCSWSFNDSAVKSIEV